MDKKAAHWQSDSKHARHCRQSYTLAARGLTAQQATTLATVIEKAFDTMMANEEGWAMLG
jgi:hypothetical protein